MKYLETNNIIFCFDTDTGITFIYVNNKWKISKIGFHELENQNLKQIKPLTEKEALIKTSGVSIKIIKNKIISLLN